MEKAIKIAIENGYPRNPQIWVPVDEGTFKIEILGKPVLIEPADHVKVMTYRWYLTQNGYAISSIRGKRTRMHHLILGKPKNGMVVDHINGDRLDNRLSNLRFVTMQQNGFNTKAVGVRQRGDSWEANVCVMYRKHFKGGFKTKEKALEWRQSIKDKYKKTIWI